jgi:cytochrome c oxidase subunit 3/cytochrome o ubiquinol oxidase subunit 3
MDATATASIETPNSLETHETDGGLDLRKLGMWIFLSSEVIFFTALIATFLIYKGRSLSGPGQELLNIPLTSLNTFILIVSSLTMVLSLDAAIKGKQLGIKIWLLATILLGTFFLSVQAFEYYKLWQEGLTPTVNLFGSAFYTLTGFHGTHVFVGVLMLTALLLKSFFGRFGPGHGFGQDHYLPIEMIGLYWHFVDLVWILLFTLVYLI